MRKCIQMRIEIDQVCIFLFAEYQVVVANDVLFMIRKLQYEKWWLRVNRDKIKSN